MRAAESGRQSQKSKAIDRRLSLKPRDTCRKGDLWATRRRLFPPQYDESNVKDGVIKHNSNEAVRALFLTLNGF